MADGIKEGHAGSKISQTTGRREDDVNRPKRERGLFDSRGQLAVLYRTWRLRTIKLHASYAQHGQNRDRKHNDAHAPKPL